MKDLLKCIYSNFFLTTFGCRDQFFLVKPVKTAGNLCCMYTCYDPKPWTSGGGNIKCIQRKSFSLKWVYYKENGFINQTEYILTEYT